MYVTMALCPQNMLIYACQDFQCKCTVYYVLIVSNSIAAQKESAWMLQLCGFAIVIFTIFYSHAGIKVDGMLSTGLIVQISFTSTFLNLIHVVGTARMGSVAGDIFVLCWY